MTRPARILLSLLLLGLPAMPFYVVPAAAAEPGPEATAGTPEGASPVFKASEGAPAVAADASAAFEAEVASPEGASPLLQSSDASRTPAAFEAEVASPEGASSLLQAPSGEATSAPEEKLDVAGIIFDHVLDAYEWHITEWKGRPVAIHLPVIVRASDGRWQLFSSKRLEHGRSYAGLRIARAGEAHEGKVVEALPDGTLRRPLDLSITKDVLSLLMSSALLLLVVLLTARWYRRHDPEKDTPTGLAALMEPLIMMVHDMARENIGEEDYRRYSPFLCMAFLFILFNNFLGIVPFFPGGANLTGNIAVTLVLALCTFFTVNLFGTKHYYKDIFLPDVPGFLKPIMPVIEVFSALSKPVSLTIRLFANMLAGHILILSVVCIIFIMAKYGPLLSGSMTLVSVLFGVFLDALECLVAFIQAYVFTMLSSIYIGLSRQKEE